MSRKERHLGSMLALWQLQIARCIGALSHHSWRSWRSCWLAASGSCMICGQNRPLLVFCLVLSRNNGSCGIWRHPDASWIAVCTGVAGDGRASKLLSLRESRDPASLHQHPCNLSCYRWRGAPCWVVAPGDKLCKATRMRAEISGNWGIAGQRACSFSACTEHASLSARPNYSETCHTMQAHTDEPITEKPYADVCMSYMSAPNEVGVKTCHSITDCKGLASPVVLKQSDA